MVIQIVFTLVHGPMMKADVESGKTEWTKEIVTALYDNIADEVNKEFPCLWKEHSSSVQTVL